MKHALLIGLVFHGILMSHASGQPQQAGSRNTRPAARPNPEIRVTETFEPSFKIEPLSVRIHGRPSDVIPFSFSIESNIRQANVEIRPIGLRQELSGQILHDDIAESTEHIRLLSATDLQLLPNIPAKIEGVVRIPHSEARHHSFGIMVRDVGAAAANQAATNPDGSLKTQANIRFITQYVLRIDLDIEGVRGENMQQLNLTSIHMAPFEGRPKLQLMVENSTDTTFEFELRSRLRSSPSDRSFKFMRMVMPVRLTMESEDRYIGRILGKSKIHMEELLPEAIASGNYEVDVELLAENRVQKRVTIPISVDAQDFPAQEVLIAQVGQSTQVSPAQVELSQQRGGSRRVTMIIKNLGKETNNIKLTALGSNDLELSAVTIQPQSFSLPPAGSRKVTLSLRSQATDEPVIYGKLFIESRTTDREFNESRDIPLAILLKQSPSATATLSPLQWNATGRYPSFQTLVKNTGQTHLPLNGRLSITDETGRRISIPAGFGRWLMPGETSKLEFRMDSLLPPGNYQLRCDVVQDDKPLTLQQTFTVNDFQGELSSR